MPLQATSGAASYDAFGGGVPVVPAYIEEVFSCFVYAGSNSSQTITNNIDLSTNGGLVWTKARTTTYSHFLTDTIRGGDKQLSSNSSGASVTSSPAEISSFNTTGYTLAGGTVENVAGQNFVGWTFRKQPKFFDIVTYTGDGNPSRVIPHNLGSTPGMIISKTTSTTGDWRVVTPAVNNQVEPNKALYLNDTSGEFDSYIWSAFSSTSITVSSSSPNQANFAGRTYVAYLFAHDAGGFGLTGTDNVISCGTFTPGAGGGATVTLGWEPQWVLVKVTGTTGNWTLIDTMRNYSLGGNPSGTNQYLRANTSGAELEAGTGNPTATGFFIDGVVAGSQPHIYIAIRRGPMKVPTVGTSVFNIDTQGSSAGKPNFKSGFPVDFAFVAETGGSGRLNSSRLTSPNVMYFNNTNAETSDTERKFDYQNGWGDSTSVDATRYSWMFKRAPSFMDVVCYTGTGVARTVAHNLAAVPELMIVKRRSASGEGWRVWQTSIAAIDSGYVTELNGTDGVLSSPATFNSTAPTATVFTVGDNPSSNSSGVTYVAYLFATCAGVSKVGSYTGNGSTQTINCGFTGGARFVLIKRTDSTGSWYVWDSSRGIVSGNDPYLLLNSTAAEVTNTDYIDAYSAGFEISSTAPAEINASGGTYIFLSIA